MLMVGVKPGEVFQGTDTAAGKVTVGTRAQSYDGKEYIFCLVAASQNLVSGNVVTISGTSAAVPMYTAIILASASPAPGVGGAMLGVAVCSITASASSYIWVQVYGSCAVLTTDTTASNLPNHLTTPSSVPGAVRGGLATASSFVDGLVFTVTASTAANYAAFLNYPHLTAG